MRPLILFCLIPFISFNQNDTSSNYKFTVGTNLYLTYYSYQEYTSNGKDPEYLVNREKLGTKLDVQAVFRNRYILTGIGIGFAVVPVHNNTFFSPQLKLAYNLRKKSEPLGKFLGPVVNTDVLFAKLTALNHHPFIYRVSPSFGLLTRSKCLQFEIGTLFRKNYSEYTIFKSSFYMSFGYYYTFKDKK